MRILNKSHALYIPNTILTRCGKEQNNVMGQCNLAAWQWYFVTNSTKFTPIS